MQYIWAENNSRAIAKQTIVDSENKNLSYLIFMEVRLVMYNQDNIRQ